MKKVMIIILGISMIALITGMLGCGSDETLIDEGAIVVNTNPQNTGIWVSADGEVMADPDLATLQLGIEAHAKTVEQAQADAAASMDAVMSALKAAGIDEKDIQTSYYSIYPNQRWDPDTEEYIVTGYRVSNMVTVKMRDLQKVGDTIDSVATAGGDLTRIQGISFSVEDPTTYQVEARKEAFDRAKAKAEQMAQLSGVTLGEVTYMTESFGYISPIRVSMDAYAEKSMGSASTPISPGEQEITANIQLAFEIK